MLSVPLAEPTPYGNAYLSFLWLGLGLAMRFASLAPRMTDGGFCRGEGLMVELVLPQVVKSVYTG